MSLQEEIKAYIDGELSPERAAQVRAALDSDPALKKEYEDMKQISQRLVSLVRQPQVRGAEKALEGAAPRKRFRWVEGLVAAAALAVLAAVLFPVFAQSKYSARKTAFSDTGDATSTQGAVPFSNGRARTQDKGVDKPNLDRDFVRGVPVESDGAIAGHGGGGGGFVSQGGFDKSLSLGAGAPKDYDGKSQEHAVGKRTAQSPTTLPSAVLDEEKYKAESATRLVIKDATFSIDVATVKKSMDDATQMAKVLGGYVESSSISDSEDVPKPTGSMVLRVPQKSFETAVTRLRAAGRVTAEQSSGDDVTAEVADIDARVKTLTAQEESYRALLRNAKKTSDILEITDRISEIRQEIESYNAQRITMGRLAALSTISVQFTEQKKVSDAPKPDNWFDDTKISAMLMLKGVGKFVAQTATYLFVLVPVWLPVALFLLWFRRRGMVTVPRSASEG